MRIYNTELFYPMLAMFLWTVVVLLRNMQVRVAALNRGELTNKYFELLKGAEPPEAVQKTGNHFRNLTEMPPLFYIICLTVMFLGRTDVFFIMLAWSYVALRVGHSLIHLTVNKVAPRFFLFAASNILLLIMWVRLAVVL
ncbi:MAG TPA: MAPEG family protein [Candidatus Polarisedimenticolaceae bacterium]|nr:MAPEG family protein [Candidatus Polarisedimenticolaceae bacterium]